MHAQPTNELLAARDCADARTPLRRMKEAADGRALPVDRPDHVPLVTRTSAQRLIATEMAFARGGQRGCKAYIVACDRHVGCPGPGDG